MNSTKRTPPNLLLYDILIDKMLRLAIILAICKFGAGIECLLKMLL